MRYRVYLSAATLLVAGCLLAGAWFMRQAYATTSAPQGAQIARYVCPMHPQVVSNRPGIAACCGMALVPEHTRQSSVSTNGSQSQHIIHVSSEIQRLIGVRLERAGLAPVSTRIRTVGRVVPDERQVYRIKAATDGWVRGTFSNSTGSRVTKGEPLVSFYAPEFLPVQRAYLFALQGMDRLRESEKGTAEQLALAEVNLRSSAESLRLLGMDLVQIEEISRTRQVADSIVIHAPVAGTVILRNISPGERIERGTELYRIADLSHVWVLADVFERESMLAQPGEVARVTHPSLGVTLAAKVSEVPPVFDPASRTLKIRLETDNRDEPLRPEMSVDVEFEMRRSPAVTVPSGAVVNSGRGEIVYVQRTEGLFEPRCVKTGWRADDRVVILGGIEPGERVVVSGNFLLDSESRMRPN